MAINPTQTRSRSGQALAEFVVALICIVVVFAGLLQIGLLGVARTHTLQNARQDAGVDAMDTQLISPVPDFIQDWDPGDDESTYSADDEAITGDAGGFTSRVLAHAHPADLQTTVPGNVISSMSESLTPQESFGLVRGRDTETVELLPAVTHLIYGQEHITIESEVWLGWTKGMY